MTRGKFYRNTRQRRVILEELHKLTSHPTATALYQIVRQRLPKVSLGTVYRNLELLAELGMIRKLQFSGSETRFDGNVDRHEHVRCVGCGRVDDVEGMPLDLEDQKHHDFGGYEILDYQLLYLGFCPHCKQQTAADGLPPAHSLNP